MQANKRDKHIPKTGELVYIAENMQWNPFSLAGFIKSGSALNHPAQWCGAASMNFRRSTGKYQIYYCIRAARDRSSTLSYFFSEGDHQNALKCSHD